MWLDLNFWLSNPFIPWAKLFSGFILLLYLYQIYWVYRDAEARFYSGVWFALLCAVLPVAGLIFYLAYRSSSLPDSDLLELKERLTERYPEVEYDLYLARKRQEEIDRFLRRLKEFFTPPSPVPKSAGLELMGTNAQYSPEVLLSREREIMRARSQMARESFQRAGKAFMNSFSLIGNQVRSAISPRYSRMLKKLGFFQKLEEAPLIDEELERLMSEGLYYTAKADAESKLKIAAEMRDQRRILTYQNYLKRVQKLIEGVSSEKPSSPPQIY